MAADEQLTAASGHTEAALVANQNSDNHVLTAVALSLSIFFAGISGKMEFFRNQIKALGLAAVIFVGAGLVLIILPKVSPF